MEIKPFGGGSPGVEYRGVEGMPEWVFGDDGSAWRYAWARERWVRVEPYLKSGERRHVSGDRFGETKPRHVGALVLEAFAGERPPHGYVRYANGKHWDDRIENLSWGDLRVLNGENAARRRGTRPGGREIKMTRREAADVIARIHRGDSDRTIAADVRVSPAAVTGIRLGVTWKSLPRPWAVAPRRRRGRVGKVV